MAALAAAAAASQAASSALADAVAALAAKAAERGREERATLLASLEAAAAWENEAVMAEAAREVSAPGPASPGLDSPVRPSGRLAVSPTASLERREPELASPASRLSPGSVLTVGRFDPLAGGGDGLVAPTSAGSLYALSVALEAPATGASAAAGLISPASPGSSFTSVRGRLRWGDDGDSLVGPATPQSSITAESFRPRPLLLDDDAGWPRRPSATALADASAADGAEGPRVADEQAVAALALAKAQVAKAAHEKAALAAAAAATTALAGRATTLASKIAIYKAVEAGAGRLAVASQERARTVALVEVRVPCCLWWVTVGRETAGD
jgi:hypothetical protein